MLLPATVDNVIRASASHEPVERVLARVASTQHGLFTRRLAEEAGATKSFIENRLRTARWEIVYPGIYRTAGTPRTWRQDVFAACLVGGESAISSHRAAAFLRDLPGGAELIEITVDRGRRVRRSGMTVHQAQDIIPADRGLVDAIPVTTPTRTLIDIASVVSADVLEEALDDALRRRLTTIRRLLWRLAQLGTRGRPGAGRLAELVAARSGAVLVESPLETRFLRLLRRARLPLPASQYEIRDRGKMIARMDFAYRDLKLAIELDGYRWHSGRAKWERDLARRNGLTALGWRVIHLTSTDLDERPSEIVAMFAGALVGSDLTRA